jgi:4-amino-4-deoxy-L-arabinose transferase-like glycosyltransferase
MATAGQLALSDPAERAASSRALLIVWAITVATAVLHLAVAGRYDAFRNELYFIVCGRHPAFGYVDQPPLVPLLAAATQAFGDNVWLLRLPAAAAAIALIPLSAAFARLAGGRTLSIVLVAAAAALSPALAGVTALLTTATFEPLAWTAYAFFIARAVLLEERRALLWAGLVAGIAMQAKYGIVMWVVPMVAGLLLTSARRILAWREFWVGAAIATLIAAPSLVWQAVHGWPFLIVISQHKKTFFTGGPIAFTLQQVAAVNLALAPLWLAGLIGPFLLPTLKRLRFFSIAFAGAAALDFVTGGKDYYLFAAYPTMFAIGGVACARLNRSVAAVWLAAAAVVFALLAPIALPLLDPPALARYLRATHLRPPPDELAAVGAPLTQVFSDEMGWRELEKQVATAYRSLPDAERSRAAIIAFDYGEAAAIDVYGKADGLPPALSGENQYFLWGSHGYDGSVILHINGSVRSWRRFCERLEVVGTFGAPYAMPYENGRPILLCHGLRANLTETWARFRRYGG